MWSVQIGYSGLSKFKRFKKEEGKGYSHKRLQKGQTKEHAREI